MMYIKRKKNKNIFIVCPSYQNFVFADAMGPQVVPVVKVRVAHFALVLGLLAALVSGVPAQRVPVLVPFAARHARPRGLLCSCGTKNYGDKHRK